MQEWVFNPKEFRRLRKELGLSKEEVCVGIGVSWPTVTSWDLGIKSPIRSNLHSLAKFLGVKPRDLMIKVEVNDEVVAG